MTLLILFAGLALIVGMATGHIPLFGVIILVTIILAVIVGRSHQ